MKPTRKLAKDYLNDATLKNYMDAVRDAKITAIDMQIIDARFIYGKSIVQIALETGYSEDKIKHTLQNAYDKVYNLIMQ